MKGLREVAVDWQREDVGFPDHRAAGEGLGLSVEGLRDVAVDWQCEDVRFANHRAARKGLVVRPETYAVNINP